MRSDNPPVFRLSEYRPPDYLIDTVDLDIDLRPAATRVEALLTLRPNPAGVPGAPLVLDGEDLKLVAIDLDGAPLPMERFVLGADRLTLPAVPQAPFRLRLVTEINPEANTRLMGLYRSNGVYCTQCEADGFRRITFFADRPDVMSVYRVRMRADRAQAPVLLSNGDLVETGSEGDRHFALWHDPHPKPCYLFALVAGDLAAVSDRFVTRSGRDVGLAVYVEKGKEDRAGYAMDALKRSMAWDEEVYGREYDLSVFNIVAVSDFNMGAMENKGLNIFNDRYILASEETATDQDYHNIEAVVAHEYFHNWTGNRITCRDWFQLCLKEGLTVFRDQEFSSDMRSRPVERIANVLTLKAGQFVEDAGPLAHPVRPREYREVNNFYTATVYNKGAEVIRMLKVLIGEAAFRAGMDLYFARHDGEAATVEQFVACFAESAGRDLSTFMRWYEQAGTPVVSVRQAYDEAGGTLTLQLRQSTAPTPGEAVKGPQVIPVALGLIDPQDGELDIGAPLLVMEGESAEFRFEGLKRRPIPSLFRGFSAPVKVESDLSEADLLVLAEKDTDAFNRYEALSRVAVRLLTRSAAAIRAGGAPEAPGALVAAVQRAIEAAPADPAFAALALSLPGENDLAREIGSDVDPDAIGAALDALQASLGKAVEPQALACYGTLEDRGPFSPDAASAGRRALRNRLLRYLVAADPAGGAALALRQFETATNMTDRVSALSALARLERPEREHALAQFEARYGEDPLVMDTWFAAQATIPAASTVERVRGLLAHPRFTLGNPNRVRSLVGSFAQANPRAFHRADGAGYDLVAGIIAGLDARNPQVAARLATAFRTWRTLEAGRSARVRAVLEDLSGREHLSRDLRDIIDRALA